MSPRILVALAIALPSTALAGTCPTTGSTQQQINCLSLRLGSVETKVETLEAENAALQAQVDEMADFFDYVTVDTASDSIMFTGANVMIRSGSGATDGATNGLGNLIIGYAEDASLARTGSHNLVLGAFNSWTSYGGMVAGVWNTTSGEYSSVLGGGENVASGYASVVSAGVVSRASGSYSAVAGGNDNEASADSSAVCGGVHNTASGLYSSATGGEYNTASGDVSWVSGGAGNVASAYHSVVSGGNDNYAETSEFSVVMGGVHNHATGVYSTVSGGNSVTVSAWAGYGP